MRKSGDKPSRNVLVIQIENCYLLYYNMVILSKDMQLKVTIWPVLGL